ncbi:phage baseplate assembly protein [Serratia fonticola]|uniref:phage baseplate assembly protein n=1 Tax=Serratia fonticola TaxID=47917 RepID=UPI003B219709
MTVDSWRDGVGRLWEPNKLVPIRLPAFGLDDVLWLLSEVTFIRNGDEGTKAGVILMPPQAFDVQTYSFYSQFPVLSQ